MPYSLTSAPFLTTPATLTRDLRRRLRRGHPWIFSDAVTLPPNAPAGAVAPLRGKDGRPLGVGYLDPSGPLAIRVLTTGADARTPEALSALLLARFKRALALRETLFPPDAAPPITGYRLIHGEGDALPGLVVDRYADTLVIKPDGPIAEAFWDVDAVADALIAHTGLSNVFLRIRSRGGAEGRLLRGTLAPLVAFQEGPARFQVDIQHGQKTGFFLDQREHRRRVGGLARGRRVLNVFGYTGGFSIHAGLGGATHVTTVDQAGPAIEHATCQWLANGLPATAHEGHVGDAFAFLDAARADERAWDLIVLDPPAFAPNHKVLPQALASYQRMVTAGAHVAAPGALLVVASCSAHVDLAALLTVIEDGLSDARRTADVLHVGGQPADHPYPLACPELAYLKVVTLRLDG